MPDPSGHRCRLARGNSRLRRENRTLKQEREFLKKLQSSSRGRTGLGEFLQAHRGGEGEFFRRAYVQDAWSLKEVGITPSLGRTGTALDNAMAESFVSTLKCELVSRMRFPTRQAARTTIFDYLEAFYNTWRLHSALGYMSLADFEEGTVREASVA